MIECVLANASVYFDYITWHQHTFRYLSLLLFVWFFQRNGAWAIRNMVSRSREQCPTFLAHGAEGVLTNAMVDHPDVAYDIKSALRDLGCNVTFKEEWTGTRNKISVQND